MIREVHIFVTGVVQGVGFRAAVKRHAALHDVRGYVRNLPDGRVEICAQGTDDQLNAFLQTVQEKPGLGSISFLDTNYRPTRESFATFEVR